LIFERCRPLLAKVDIRGIGHRNIAENISKILKRRNLHDEILLEIKKLHREGLSLTEHRIHSSCTPAFNRIQVWADLFTDSGS
jgi:hypothetical protein